MLKRTVSGIMLATMFAMFLGPAMLVRGAAPPSIIHVHFGTEYSVRPDGSEFWGHCMDVFVTDPDGLDNLFIDGEISIEILAPDGYIYPMPGDIFSATVLETDPPQVDIFWHRMRLPDPPVLGSYEITITDRDGLSTTYVTQPTVRVSDRVSTITYPPNFGVIHEANPTFTWEAFSPQTTWYYLGLGGPEFEWCSPHLSPDQLSYTYDGPELVRGEIYTLRFSAFEDEVVGENENRRVTSKVWVSFTLSARTKVRTVQVEPKTKRTLRFDLDKRDNFSCSLAVSGGANNDIKFWITDPSKNTIVNLGRISQTPTFEFTAQESGAYTFHFDNTFSSFSWKNVSLSYDISRPAPSTIVDIGTIIIVVLLIVTAIIIGLGVLLYRRKRQTISKPSQPMPT